MQRKHDRGLLTCSAALSYFLLTQKLDDFILTAAVSQACIIHLTGHSAFHIVHCMESAADVLNAAQPVSIYREKQSIYLFLQSFGRESHLHNEAGEMRRISMR